MTSQGQDGSGNHVQAHMDVPETEIRVRAGLSGACQKDIAVGLDDALSI